MTYFILKKLQESKGDATLGELSEYVINNVKRTSVLEKDKSQTCNPSFINKQQLEFSNLKIREDNKMLKRRLARRGEPPFMVVVREYISGQ